MRTRGSIRYVLFRTIEAHNRPREQSERRDTLIYQCWVCHAPLSFVYPRVPIPCAAVSPRRYVLSDQPRGAENIQGREKRERERKRGVRDSRQRNKQEPPPVWDRGLATRRGMSRHTLIPQFFVSPMQYRSFMTSSLADGNDCYRRASLRETCI